MRNFFIFLAALAALCVPAMGDGETADWIGIPQNELTKSGNVVYHKSFKLDISSDEAYLKFTCYTPADFATTHYKVYINGISGPGGTYWKDAQAVNLSTLLSRKNNDIDIEVSWTDGGTAGPILAKLFVKGKDKDKNDKSVEIRSDDSWTYFKGKFNVKNIVNYSSLYKEVSVFGSANAWAQAVPPTVLPKINTSTVVGVTSTKLKCGYTGSTNLFDTAKDLGDKYYFIDSLGFHFMEDKIYAQSCYQEPGQWFLGYDKQIVRNDERGNFAFSAAPILSIPPDWYMKQNSPQVAQCLEHGQNGFSLSPWSPDLIKLNASFYSELKNNFSDQVSSITPGIYGDSGEACFISGQNKWLSPAPDHQHAGFWAGDPLAKTDFMEKMLAKYLTVDTINKAWNTAFTDRSQITYPKLDGTSSRRQNLDFANWYYDSMSQLTNKICTTARQNFPNIEISPRLICSDDSPMRGQDSTVVIKEMAKLGGGVRAEKCGASALNFGRISSACKFYGTKLEVETGSDVNRTNAQRKYFLDASSGCSQIFARPDDILNVADIFSQSRREIQGEHSITEIALFYPTSWHRANLNETYPPKLSQAADEVRDMFDYDILDETMIEDGALAKYHVLMMFDGSIIDQQAYDRISNWVNNGGTLILRSEQLPITNIEGSALPLSSSLGKNADGDSINEQGKGQIIVWNGDWADRSDYYAMALDAAYPSMSDGLSGSLDGKLDGVWSSLFKDHSLYVNNTDSPVHIDENVSEDFAQRVGLNYRTKYLKYSLDIPARSEAVHFFSKPFIESPIECERMQGTEKLKKQIVYKDGFGAPGWAVKMSAGNTIGTSFMVEEDADYSFCCIVEQLLSGMLQLEVDGQRVASVTCQSGDHDYMYPMNAKVHLTPGRHMVSLKAASGDFLADKIIVTTDTSIEGFTYGYIDPQIDQSW